MKILFVNSFESPDYLNDMIYHGLVNSPGVFVYESSWPGYMLKGYQNPETLYGRGFTLYARMLHTPKVCPEWVINEKIADKYYDYVVYGSVVRCVDFIDLVLKAYSKDKIIFLDGEDQSDIKKPALLSSGFYFKREIIANTEGVKPISFCIPEEHVLKFVPKKFKQFATVIPGDASTYVFSSEEDYFKDYSCSYYGHTCKKAGFDCLRHYEILASGCVPAFNDLDKIPDTVMTSFPKSYLQSLQQDAFAGKIPSDYDKHAAWLLDYTRNNLTTVKEARRLLERVV